MGDQTSPMEIPGEAAMTSEALERFLAALDEEMILVGGQALAFWMQRFDIPAQGANMISRDGDVIGKIERAYKLRDDLKATLSKPPATERTAIVAQIRMDIGGGEKANIDVLHQVYAIGGLKKAGEFTRRVIAQSAVMQMPSGKKIRVMNPFDLLDSRVQNAAGLLDSKGPHVLTQARWAIEVARVALRKLAEREGEGGERLGVRLQGVFALARSSSGRQLLKDHDIDVLAAIDVEELRRLSPAHEQQLANIDSVRSRPRGGSAAG